MKQHRSLFRSVRLTLFVLAFATTANLGAKPHKFAIALRIEGTGAAAHVTGLFGKFQLPSQACRAVDRTTQALPRVEGINSFLGSRVSPDTCKTAQCPYGENRKDPCAPGRGHAIESCGVCNDWGCESSTSGCCAVCTYMSGECPYCTDSISC